MQELQGLDAVPAFRLSKEKNLCLQAINNTKTNLGTIFEYCSQTDRMKFLFLFAALFFLKPGFAQNAPDTSNSVLIHKDYRIDELSKKQAAINAAIKKAAARTARGFRLLVV